MKPRILLVEDDPTSRVFLQAATESLPAQVETAGSVADALAIATCVSCALWLIDAQLPDGSGASLLRQLRGQGLHTPAIAHTASHERAAHEALLASGFAATIAKPLPTADWQAAIRQVLGGRGPLPPERAAPATADRGEAPAWDEAHALAALGGDAAHVSALRALFLAELPSTRDAVVSAALRGDVAGMCDQLHRLRAGCGFVGALRLQRAAEQLQAAPGSETALHGFLGAVQDILSPD